MILKVKIKALSIIFLLSADWFFNEIIKNEGSSIIMAKGDKKVIEEKKVIKETKYCEVYKAVSIIDDDYYSSIEKIKVKSKNREEVRFALYKDTFKMERQFIPRSLDLTEKQLLELIRKAIEGKVFSDEFIKLLKDELNKIWTEKGFSFWWVFDN